MYSSSVTNPSRLVLRRLKRVAGSGRLLTFVGGLSEIFSINVLLNLITFVD